jgi:hypothetical protein
MNIDHGDNSRGTVIADLGAAAFSAPTGAAAEG